MTMLSPESCAFEYTSMESGCGVFALLDPQGPNEFRITVEIEDYDGEVVRIWEYPADLQSLRDGRWDFFLRELIDRVDAGSLDYHW